MRLRSFSVLGLSISAGLGAWACTTSTAGLPDISFDAAVYTPPYDTGPVDLDGGFDGAPAVAPLPISVRAVDYRGTPLKQSRVIFVPSTGAPAYERALDPQGIATSDPTLTPISVLFTYNCDGTCATAIVGAEPGEFIEAFEDSASDPVQVTLELPPATDAGTVSQFFAYDGCYNSNNVYPGTQSLIYASSLCTKKGFSSFLLTANDANNNPLFFAARSATILDGGAGSLVVPTASWLPPSGNGTLSFAVKPGAEYSYVQRSVAFASAERVYATRVFDESATNYQTTRQFAVPPAGMVDGIVYSNQLQGNVGGANRSFGSVGRVAVGSPVPAYDLTKALPSFGPVTIDTKGATPAAVWPETGPLAGTLGYANFYVQFQGDAGSTSAGVTALFPHVAAGKLPLDFLRGVDSGAITNVSVNGVAFVETGALGAKALRAHPSRFVSFINGAYGIPGTYDLRYVVSEGNNK